MDLNDMSKVVSTVGFPITMVLILIVGFVYVFKYINQKDKQNREDTKEQIQTLREENKEDKALFQRAISSFDSSVKEFKNVNMEMTAMNREMLGMKDDLKDVKQDILVIKTKMDK